MELARAVILAIASVVMLPSLPACAEPAAARTLSDELAGRSVQCGLGTALYFDPAMRTADTIDFADGDFPIAENRTRIDASRIRSSEADRFEVVLRTRDGDTRHRFERRDGISLYVGDDDVGDQCALVRGRADFIKTRFNMIRESLCGNDPKPSCIARLRRTCGISPKPDCVRRLRRT